MSGFAVEFRRGAQGATLDNANRMKAAMQVFGADRRSAEASGSFAAAWVQSAGFTPQDHLERQPVLAQERWKLLFLGRLGHLDELAAKLGIEQAELKRLPDCELAMRAWCKWGEACRDHLFGGYTMVVCDLIERRLVALRSAERSQHLYYYYDAERIVLSTSTKGIFAFPEIPREVDEAKIADMLVLNHQDVSRSYFRNVSVLPLGHTLRIECTGEPKTAYANFLDDVASVRYARDEDYTERAQELLDRALASAFRSPTLPAISLSSGLDSTALAVTMIERMRREGRGEPGALKAYTAVPSSDWDGRVAENRIGDESGPVRALAAMYPELDTHFLSGEMVPFDQNIDMIQSYSDMPVRGVGNNAWGSAIYQKCREHRKTMIVSGVSGNGTISFAASHILFARWLRGGNWATLAQEIRAFVKQRPGSDWKSILGQAGITNLPDRLYDLYMDLRGHKNTVGFEAWSGIHPDFAHDIGVRRRMESFGFDDRYRRRPDRHMILRNMMQQGARNDAAGMIEPARVMSGVEAFTPFDDRKLIEFCFAIPDDQYYQGGVDRRLVKQMMKAKLPKEVLSARRGEQSSDWHGRMKRDQERIVEELDRLGDIPSVASRIDIERLKRVSRTMPDDTPVSNADYNDRGLARYGLARALSVARFINQVEGRN